MPSAANSEAGARRKRRRRSTHSHRKGSPLQVAAIVLKNPPVLKSRREENVQSSPHISKQGRPNGLQ